MILHVEGNATAIQKWMADAKKSAVAEQKKFHKEHRDYYKARKEVPPRYTTVEQARLDTLAQTERMCNRTILPVAVQGVVINGKLLDAMLKKLKSCHIAAETGQDENGLKWLRIVYRKDQTHGELELYDISEHYPEELVPEGEIRHG